MNLDFEPVACFGLGREEFGGDVEGLVGVVENEDGESAFVAIYDCFHYCIMNVVSSMMLLQVTLIGQLPEVVLAPTVHVHETRPAGDAALGSSPAAWLGPDL